MPIVVHAVKAAATYCSRMTDPSHSRIPAIDRWRSVRIKQSQQLAAQSRREFYLLTAKRGLIHSSESVGPDATTLKERDLASAAELVVKELTQYGIENLLFFANPFQRDGMNFVRLMVLACAEAKVDLELASFDGTGFPDWIEIMREAEETMARANKNEAHPVKQFFDPLLQKFPDDGMVWYCLGRSHEKRTEFANAIEAYAKARELFPLKEWKDKARAAEEKLKHASRRASASTDLSDARIDLVMKLRIPDHAIKVLSEQAFKALSISPTAAVALCRTALIRIIQSCNPTALDQGDRTDYLRVAIDNLQIGKDVRRDMHDLRMRRNDIEFALRPLPNQAEAAVCVSKLFEILNRLYPLGR